MPTSKHVECRHPQCIDIRAPIHRLHFNDLWCKIEWRANDVLHARDPQWEAGNGTCLTLKASDEGLIVGQLVLEHLDCHMTVPSL